MSTSLLPGDAPDLGLEKLFPVADPSLLKVLSAIARSVVDIGTGLRTGGQGFSADKIGSMNTFGDEQLQVDVSSDERVFVRLKQSGVVPML